MSEKQCDKISRAIQRDPDLRTLRMCVKYLDTVCSKRMQRPTIEYLVDRFITHPVRGESEAD